MHCVRNKSPSVAMPRTAGSRNRSTLAAQESAPERLEAARAEWSRIQKEYLALERARTPEEKARRKALEKELNRLDRELKQLSEDAEDKRSRDRNAAVMEEMEELIGILVDRGHSAEDIRKLLEPYLPQPDEEG